MLMACQQYRYHELVTTSPNDRTLDERSRPRHVGTSIEGAPVGSLLLQVLRAHARVGTELLSEAGVASPHEIVLLYLDTHGAVPQTELVHYMGRDRSTVTATLQAMERAGLVTRLPSPSDKRAMIVRLAKKGRDAVPRAQAAWHELERRTTRSLTPSQRANLMTALTAVRDALNEQTDK
jgi:MarR family transcriptional regulator, lower aerobic nicotinate degradation pathway regulator